MVLKFRRCWGSRVVVVSELAWSRRFPLLGRFRDPTAVVSLLVFWPRGPLCPSSGCVLLSGC